MLDLIPSFGNTLYTIGAFVIALSIIVAVHEYGHYIVGRWCGIKADVFSLGFGPVLWSRPDRHGTVWQIAALPFGGYVKFHGDADASSVATDADFESMEPEAQRHTMHGAPLWARAATVAAGPVFNFILSIVVFAAFTLVFGVPRDTPVVVGELMPMPERYAHLQTGDELVSVEGIEISKLADLMRASDDLPQEPTLTYEVRREGVKMTVPGPFPAPPMVGSVAPGSAAADAGLQVGDVIQAIDDAPLTTFSQLQKIAISSEGRELKLSVWRGGEIVEFRFRTRLGPVPTEAGLEDRWLIGMGGDIPFDVATRTPGIFEAMGYGVDRTYYIVQTSLNAVYRMATGWIDSCSLRGPIGIAQTSGAAASQGLDAFIGFIAVLSTAVGLLNLFPIPVLDGGHLVFHAYEAVSGKPPSDRALRILMSIGLALIATLMAFALTNDFLCP
ncbi:MAG: RIP metalloprotease RseP [Rhodobacteraceae bacterium]|nr:RIP metalloprotease RseP [Paracoccaceae bacterium]